jgi:hypothetical protein
MQGSRELDPSAVQRYTVRRAPQPLGAPEAAWEHPLWQGAEVATISHWEWPDPDGPENGPQGVHRPRTQAKVLYDDSYLALLWCVDDEYVRAQATAFQGQTCRDSCCEFFVAPHPDSHDATPFFNFETNAGGTMLLYNCTQSEARGGNVPLSEEDGAAIVVKASLRPDCGTDSPWGAGRQIEPELTGPNTWCIEYHVPWSLFTKHFGVAAPPDAGTVWRCNFYKCADQTSHPHWGAWAPVGTTRPDFHRPSDFQQLVFGEADADYDSDGFQLPVRPAI